MVPLNGNGHWFFGPGNLDLAFHDHANKFVVVYFTIAIEIGARNEGIDIIGDITIFWTPIEQFLFADFTRVVCVIFGKS